MRNARKVIALQNCKSLTWKRSELFSSLRKVLALTLIQGQGQDL